MLQTKRDYAASLGLAQAGTRGRLSRAAHEAIAKAESGGMTFAESTPPRNTGKPREINLKDKPKPAAASNEPGIMAEPTSPDGTYWTYANDKGKTVKVNGRQVCMDCGYSLEFHGCRHPKAVTVDGVQELKVIYPKE